VAQRDHHRQYVADFGNDEFAGVGEIVGIADVEQVTTTVRIADGGDVFRTRRPADGKILRFDSILLCLHCCSPVPFLLMCIVDKAKCLKYIAKVIEICGMGHRSPQSPVLPGFRFLT